MSEEYALAALVAALERAGIKKPDETAAEALERYERDRARRASWLRSLLFERS